MNTRREILMCMTALFSSVFFFLAVFLGLVLHIGTVIIAYKINGILAAILSFPFPVFAQIFWFIRIWMLDKTFFNPFCILLSSYVIFWGIILGLSFISQSLEAIDMRT